MLFCILFTITVFVTFAAAAHTAHPSSVSHLLESVGTFARNFEPNDPTNPYRVTLRKLWAKLAEKNWRTTLKALYLLHSLA